MDPGWRARGHFEPAKTGRKGLAARRCGEGGWGGHTGIRLIAKHRGRGGGRGTGTLRLPKQGKGADHDSRFGGGGVGKERGGGGRGQSVPVLEGGGFEAVHEWHGSWKGDAQALGCGHRQGHVAPLASC